MPHPMYLSVFNNKRIQVKKVNLIASLNFFWGGGGVLFYLYKSHPVTYMHYIFLHIPSPRSGSMPR